MVNTSDAIDAYIDNAAAFAQPILRKIRAYMHQYCPEIEEGMKWSFPHFVYRKKHLFSMAAFKQHCTCGFRLAPMMNDPKGLFLLSEKKTMRYMANITSVKDLPGDLVWKSYIHEAMQLTTTAGVKLPKFRPFKETETPFETPDYFLSALKHNEKAMAVFDTFLPATRRAYIQWINNAKYDATRQQRIVTSIEWIAAGKRRYWKYEKH